MGLLVVALILLGVGGVFVWQWLTRPDLVVVVKFEESTLTKETQAWIDESVEGVAQEGNHFRAVEKRRIADVESAHKALEQVRKSAKPELSDVYRAQDTLQLAETRLDALRSGRYGDLGGLERLEKSSFVSDVLARKARLRQNELLELTIRNESDDPIERTRIRVPQFGAWKVRLEGAFLTANETERWQAAFTPVSPWETVVLPELPTIPAKQELTIVAHGDFSDQSELVVIPASASTTAAVVREVHVIDEWPASMILHPWALVAAIVSVFTFLGGAGALGKLVLDHTRQVVEANIYPVHAIEIARWLTRRGDAEAATQLLKFAVSQKATTKQAVRDDEEFRSLWEVESFRDHFGEPTATPSKTEATAGANQVRSDDEIANDEAERPTE